MRDSYYKVNYLCVLRNFWGHIIWKNFSRIFSRKQLKLLFNYMSLWGFFCHIRRNSHCFSDKLVWIQTSLGRIEITPDRCQLISLIKKYNPNDVTVLSYELQLKVLFLFRFFWKYFFSIQNAESLADGKGDARDARSLLVQILSFSCSFWQRFVK